MESKNQYPQEQQEFLPRQQPPRRVWRITPLLKPSSRDCNLGCDYCFYLENPHVTKGNRTRRMSETVVRRFMEDYLAIAPDEAIFAWQGGEPTLLGLDFFTRAFAIQNELCRPGQRAINTFQTNAVLIDDGFAEFFAEHHVLVGVSLDGPESIHDRHRRSAGGTPTWGKVMAAIDRLRRAEAEFNILCVLHKDNCKRARDIYRFYRAEGFDYMQFIPCTEQELNRRGKPTGKLTPFTITADDYTRFLLELFELWYADFQAGHRISIRLFDHILNRLAGFEGTMCLYARQCDQQVVLEADGRVYPCDFFVQAQWAMGNILNESLVAMLEGPTYQAFIEQSRAMPRECASCQWKELCHGGCPRERLLLGGPPSSSNYFCETYKTFYAKTIDRFQDIVRQLVAEQRNAYSPV